MEESIINSKSMIFILFNSNYKIRSSLCKKLDAVVIPSRFLKERVDKYKVSSKIRFADYYIVKYLFSSKNLNPGIMKEIVHGEYFQRNNETAKIRKLIIFVRTVPQIFYDELGLNARCEFIDLNKIESV